MSTATELRKLLKGRDIYAQTNYGRNYWNAYTKLYVAKGNNIINITWMAAEVMGAKMKDGRIPYGDFDSVYNLGRKLYPRGYKCDGDNCHSNDHVNGWDGVGKHSDGGYKYRKRDL